MTMATNDSSASKLIFSLCINMIFIYLLQVNVFRHSNKYGIYVKRNGTHMYNIHWQRRRKQARDDGKCICDDSHRMEFWLAVLLILFLYTHRFYAKAFLTVVGEFTYTSNKLRERKMEIFFVFLHMENTFMHCKSMCIDGKCQTKHFITCIKLVSNKLYFTWIFSFAKAKKMAPGFPHRNTQHTLQRRKLLLKMKSTFFIEKLKSNLCQMSKNQAKCQWTIEESKQRIHIDIHRITHASTWNTHEMRFYFFLHFCLHVDCFFFRCFVIWHSNLPFIVQLSFFPIASTLRDFPMDKEEKAKYCDLAIWTREKKIEEILREQTRDDENDYIMINVWKKCVTPSN